MLLPAVAVDYNNLKKKKWDLSFSMSSPTVPQVDMLLKFCVQVKY